MHNLKYGNVAQLDTWAMRTPSPKQVLIATVAWLLQNPSIFIYFIAGQSNGYYPWIGLSHKVRLAPTMVLTSPSRVLLHNVWICQYCFYTSGFILLGCLSKSCCVVVDTAVTLWLSWYLVIVNLSWNCQDILWLSRYLDNIQIYSESTEINMIFLLVDFYQKSQKFLIF